MKTSAIPKNASTQKTECWSEYCSVKTPVAIFLTLTSLSRLANIIIRSKSRDSSVSIVLGYGLDDLGSRVRFPVEAGNLSLHHRVQNGSEAYPASYPMGTGDSFTGGKAAGA
jgi:hypothetical protein